MIKNVPVLALEGGMLHSIWVEETPSGVLRQDVRSWPISDVDLDDESNGSADVSSDVEKEVEDDGSSPLISALREAVAFYKTNEFAICVPLCETLGKVSTAPSEASEDVLQLAQSDLESITPFPDDELKVGMEIVGESENLISYFACAYPEKVALELGASLEEAKINIVHTDVLALGQMQMLWKDINIQNGISRRLILLNFASGWDVCVFNDGKMEYLRGLGSINDANQLYRDVLLSLISQGSLSGVGEVVVCSSKAIDPSVKAALEKIAGVREIVVEDVYLGVEGCARRMLEDDSIDITPSSWHQNLLESRFLKKAFRWMGVVGAFFVFVVLAFIAGPMVYDHMRDTESKERNKHRREYQEIKKMQKGIEMVQRYSDYSYGMLEILRVISENMPETVNLTRFSYEGPRYSEEETEESKEKRLGTINLRCKASVHEDVVEFNNALNSCGYFKPVKKDGASIKEDRGGGFSFEYKATLTSDELISSGRDD